MQSSPIAFRSTQCVPGVSVMVLARVTRSRSLQTDSVNDDFRPNRERRVQHHPRDLQCGRDDRANQIEGVKDEPGQLPCAATGRIMPPKKCAGHAARRNCRRQAHNQISKIQRHRKHQPEQSSVIDS